MKLTSAGVLLVLGTVLSAQNGSATLPANYKVQFENDWVKVTSVRYEPREKLPGHPRRFAAKFERPLTAASQPIVQFEHPQVRISRVWALPGRNAEVATFEHPALLIALASGASFERGQAQWVPPSTTVRVQNATAVEIDFLRFDFRTQPVAATRH